MRAARLGIGLGVLVLIASGCSATEPRANAGPPATSGTDAPTRSGAAAEGGSERSDGTRVLSQTTTDGGSGAPRKPAPPDLPWEPDSSVPLNASVSPICVSPGGTMTLAVETGPEAGIAYHAIYSDNKGGAQPPYGGGYGGNDNGFSDGSGMFTDTWVVGVNAPPGPARVDVIVGYDGRWSYAGPEFTVAPTGTC